MTEREELLTEFAAAKQFVSDIEYRRNIAYAHAGTWSAEQQAELDEAKAERSRLAREIHEQNKAARA